MISEQLLQTKLNIPKSRPATVSRPRLTECLNTGLDSKLTLISAPAGFGKTTLAAEWVSSTGRPVAWLALDDGDNDLALYIEYFLAALRKVKPQIGASALRLFRSSQSFQVKMILTDLINEICSLSDHFFLVLDDYHVINNKSIHDTLDFLIDNMPLNMHLIILTRSDPPLHLAHLRGRGQLTELRAVDLRFTLEEIQEFLNQVMKLNLSQEEINSLEIRSEGWIAGLQMAAISLKGHSDTAGFIQAFSGSNRDILDYLFEEVFERQSEDIRSFLLQTAILDQLTGSLCDAVTGRNDSSKVLETMKRANLFVLPLDDDGRWYRYHRLFADLLLHNLRISQPDSIPVLHERASLWYEQNGPPALAIEHALAGHSFTMATALIQRHAEKTLTNGELATLIRWINALPRESIEASPILNIYRALAKIWLHGRSVKRGETWMPDIKLDPPELAGQYMVVEAIAAAAQGDTPRSVELAHQALDVLPQESTFWRSIVIPCLGQFSLLRGELPAVPVAVNLFNEAVQMGEKTGNLFTTVLALRRLAEVNIAAGHLHEAQSCYQRIVDLAVDARGHLLPVASFGLIGLGGLARERHDLEKATTLLNEGISLASEKLGLWQLEGYVSLARVRQEQGDADGAIKLIQKARQLTIESNDSGDSKIFLAAHETHLYLRQGNLEAAVEWVRKRGLDNISRTEIAEAPDRKALAGYYVNELERVTLTRVYIAQSRLLEAIEILEAVLKSSDRLARKGIMIEVLMLEALAYKGLGNLAMAIELLKRALSLAEPEGYAGLFIEEGTAMAGLLYEAAQQKIMPEYTRHLLGMFPSLPQEPVPAKRLSGMVEPLSDREVEVLNLLAKGLPNKEIAGRLCIELRTVKWHTGNIFGKLGVKNRTQAVARAQDLNILSPATNLSRK